MLRKRKSLRKVVHKVVSKIRRTKAKALSDSNDEDESTSTLLDHEVEHTADEEELVRSILTAEAAAVGRGRSAA